MSNILTIGNRAKFFHTSLTNLKEYIQEHTWLIQPLMKEHDQVEFLYFMEQIMSFGVEEWEHILWVWE